jgi:hypothetical protein
MLRNCMHKELHMLAARQTAPSNTLGSYRQEAARLSVEHVVNLTQACAHVQKASIASCIDACNQSVTLSMNCLRISSLVAL